MKTEMNDISEVLGEGADPDDLAALVCAAMRQAGVTPHVSLWIEHRGEKKMATAIEVRRADGSSVGGVLIASFPIGPVEVDAMHCAGLMHAIASIGSKKPAPWDDAPLPEDAAIDAAFPTRSESHETYAEAMRLVGARRSKQGLVALVNWLLFRIAALEKEIDDWLGERREYGDGDR